MSVKAQVNDLRVLQTFAQSDYVKQRLHRAAADEALRLVSLGFRTETDPDGNPWLPLKHRHGKILRKTARMANSFTARPTARGFVVGSNVAYVTFHQDGTQGRSKDSSRWQATHIDERGRYTFVRKGGRARLRGDDGKRKLTYLGVSASINLRFNQGSGAIPIRRMVPANGVLTARWQTAIDKAVRNSMANMLRGSGVRG